MSILWLRLRAPFAAYRPMQAGSLRATAPAMPYTALWGLALNLAGIETRSSLDCSVTGIDPGAPRLRLTIGWPGEPARIASLLQQLHGYPVGATSRPLQSRTHGAKYHIAPVRRELLVDLDMVAGIEGEESLVKRMLHGLAGTGDWRRYGLPFAGDNNLLFDHIDPLAQPPTCRWYVPVDPAGQPQAGTTRLLIGIDRADSSRTRSALVAPMSEPCTTPPASAWQQVPAV